MSVATPPRSLHPGLKRELVWGSRLLGAGILVIFLTLLALLLLLQTYGVGLRSLLIPQREQITVQSRVDMVAPLPVAGGGQVESVVARVKINGQETEVKGYSWSAQPPQVGQAVTIVIPTESPDQAYLLEFDRYPVAPNRLFFLALPFLLPGLTLALLGLDRGRRRVSLLQDGQAQEADRLRTLPLPRPLAERALVQFEYHSDSAPRRVWLLVERACKARTLLVKGRNAALYERLKVVLDEQQEQLVSSSGERGRVRRFNLLLVASSLALVLLFLLS